MKTSTASALVNSGLWLARTAECIGIGPMASDPITDSSTDGESRFTAASTLQRIN